MEGISVEEFRLLEAKAETGAISAAESKLLEPYLARRAVLLASGMGSRLAPITINTPKPLVNVNGRRIITTLLDALLAAGVEDIIVVTGYLKEEFDLLKREYPSIRLVENPRYSTTNNISSACRALEADPDAFKNAYVFESDLFLKNPQLIRKYRYESCYMGVKVGQTPDWCFDVRDGYIRDLHKGGRNCHHMFGISYWTAEDGGKLARDLPECFAEEGNRQRFWDDVPCVLRSERYRIRIQECSFDDIAEIDSFEELQEIDPRYQIR